MPCPPQIQSQKRKAGILAPKRFVQRLKRDNELFRSYMHQARALAHLFLLPMALTSCQHACFLQSAHQGTEEVLH